MSLDKNILIEHPRSTSLLKVVLKCCFNFAKNDFNISGFGLFISFNPLVPVDNKKVKRT